MAPRLDLWHGVVARLQVGRMQSHIERAAKSVETIEGATILGARDLDA